MEPAMRLSVILKASCTGSRMYILQAARPTRESDVQCLFREYTLAWSHDFPCNLNLLFRFVAYSDEAVAVAFSVRL
jgi:hypothetical protein